VDEMLLNSTPVQKVQELDCGIYVVNGYLMLKGENNPNVKCIINNVMGNSILSQQKLPVCLKSLPRGTYIVTIDNGTLIRNYKIII
jgi:hypothetical protein